MASEDRRRMSSQQWIRHVEDGLVVFVEHCVKSEGVGEIYTNTMK